MSPAAPPTDLHELFAQVRVVPVVVVEDEAQALALGTALLEGGLPIAEITFRTAGARAAIAAVTRELPELATGAGTVINAEQVDQAVDAGARFIVSPGLSADVVRRAQHHGLPVFPGVATPSDIMAALALGLDVVKFFPAGINGGVPAIKALSAPFPGLRIIPTGGVSPANATEYLSVPAVLAVGGSWMVEKSLVDAGDYAEIARRSAEAVALAAAPAPVAGK
ncbi:bifunctional 4-hydroxy-2-oxoglutarate aldolase/2-dehydro-3-deoxy-phosphogluconate aldolase [Oerskovia turbata]